MSLLPICACKQKANHATSLCILKRSNKPTKTWTPRLPAQGCLPSGGTRALRCPPGVREPCVPSLSRPCGSGLFLRPPGACPSVLPLGSRPGLPLSPADFPEAPPAGAGGSPPPPGPRPAARPPGRARVLQAGWHHPPPGGDTCPWAPVCLEGTGTSQCFPPSLFPSRRRVLGRRPPLLYPSYSGNSGGEVLGGCWIRLPPCPEI